MNKLDDKMKLMLTKQLPYQATTSKDGLPDIGPKRTIRYYDDNTLIYNENTGGQTLKNIQDGSKMVVAIVDWEALDGYRFLVKPEVFGEGKYYDECVKYAEEKGMKPPKYAVVLHIEEIFTLKSGPTAGSKL